jgi:hypothetical protein
LYFSLFEKEVFVSILRGIPLSTPEAPALIEVFDETSVESESLYCCSFESSVEVESNLHEGVERTRKVTS